MIPKCPTPLLLLAGLISGLCATPVVAAAGDSALQLSLQLCETRLQHVLYLPLSKLRGQGGDFPARRIGESTPITDRFAQDYHLLLTELEDHIQPFSPDTRDVCRRIGGGLIEQHESFYLRRFELLLGQGDPERFYSEYQTILSHWGTRAEQRRIGDRFRKAQDLYLGLMLPVLQRELLSTRWDELARITPKLENWNEEWLAILGTDAPGAVVFSSQRVAIRAGQLNPVAIRIILFHELSHLADPRLRTPEGRESLTEAAAEEYAWNETWEYLRTLEQAGVEIPFVFQNKRKLARDIGLREWVKAVVASRTIR